MKRSLAAFGLLLLLLLCSNANAQQRLAAPWDSVAQILKAPGTLTGDYYRYTIPRRDIVLKMGDVTVAPGLALGTWIGFSGPASATTMMGDLVLKANEVRAVLAELTRQQIGVTAIHNHLSGETPKITYVHYHAEGRALDLANRVARVLARTTMPLPVAAAEPQPLSIDTALVFTRLGKSGRATGSVAQLTFNFMPSAVTEGGKPLNAAQAYGSPINVQMVDSTRAVATGDFSVAAAHVQPVIDALTTHGITPTAVHTHLIGELPKVYYIHFWADGPITDVLAGLKAAIDVAK
jgi:hypothetical protein